MARAANRELQFWSIAEVADLLGVSDKTVQRLISRGELPRHRIGAQVRISDHDLRAFVAQRRDLG